MVDSIFIGIDLAWQSEKHPSGAAVLRGGRQGARLIDVTGSLNSSDEVLSHIEKHRAESTCLAVDAPLIVKNREGQRSCENQISKKYGSRDASCHSTNLSRYPQPIGVGLTSQLRDFRHAIDPSQLEKKLIMLEVYPHPALLELFNLPRTIKYKKGKVEERRAGQRELARRTADLSQFDPPLQSTPELSKFLAIEPDSLRGRELKRHEDALDAVICAYIAYYYWFWGTQRTCLFGDIDSGYIVVPTRTDVLK